MKNLIFVGAGSWALEVWSWIENSHGYREDFIFKGFLDINPHALDDKKYCTDKILESELTYTPCSDDVFVCTISNVHKKKEIVDILTEKGAVFTNLIHKSVIFFKGINLGVGIIISPNCIVSNNTYIGDHVAINLGSTIGHDVKIGDFSIINSQTDLTGNVVIGSSVFLGSSVSIIPNVKIADFSIIGAGSIVYRNIKKSGTYIGNPAKRII